MFSSSANPRHSSDRTRRGGSASSVPSPYDELRQWESDEDLIQLDSPDLISDDITIKKSRTPNLEERHGKSKKGGRE